MITANQFLHWTILFVLGTIIFKVFIKLCNNTHTHTLTHTHAHTYTHKTQLVLAATEQFNKKPKQGITFLLEQGVFDSPLKPEEVAGFLLENHGLSKARIGEFVGERKNSEILLAFVRCVVDQLISMQMNRIYFCEKGLIVRSTE